MSDSRVLPAADLTALYRQGVVHNGSTLGLPDPMRRLQRVLHRADSGLPVIVAGVGASVVGDFGGVVGRFQDRFRLAYCCTPSFIRGTAMRSGWLLPIFAEVAGAVPHNGSALVNCGRPGNPIGCFLGCTATLVPENADLLIVDAATIGEKPANVEKLLRRLLSMPRSPAVLFVNIFTW